MKVNLRKQESNKTENSGSVGQKKAFTLKEVKLIKDYLRVRNNSKSIRDLALLSFGLDTLLRSVDLLRLKVSDVVDSNGNLLEVIEIQQKKTKKTVLVEITEDTQQNLANYIEHTNKGLEDYLFTGLTHNSSNKPITRAQYGNIIKGFITEILGKDPSEYNSHSINESNTFGAKCGSIYFF